jgi:hypothetical protein
MKRVPLFPLPIRRSLSRYAVSSQPLSVMPPRSTAIASNKNPRLRTKPFFKVIVSQSSKAATARFATESDVSILEAPSEPFSGFHSSFFARKKLREKQQDEEPGFESTYSFWKPESRWRCVLQIPNPVKSLCFIWIRQKIFANWSRQF